MEEEKSETISTKNAQEILGKDFLGPDQIEQATGFLLDRDFVPSIPFSKAELRKAKTLGQFLIFRCVDADGSRMKMQRVKELFETKYAPRHRKVTVSDLYGASYWEKDPTNPGWALVSKDFTPESANKNYLEQTEAITAYLKNSVYENGSLPDYCKQAIEEFETYLKTHSEFTYARENGTLNNVLDGGGWKIYAKELADLRINHLFRQTPSEVLYDINVYYAINGEELTKNKFTWTNHRDPDSYLVRVGIAGMGGATIIGWGPGSLDATLGVFFSRRR